MNDWDGANITGRLFWLASSWICCWICAPGVAWKTRGRAAFSDAQELAARRCSSAGTWVFSVVKRTLKLSGSTPVYCTFVEAPWLVVGGGAAAGGGAAGPH